MKGHVVIAKYFADPLPSLHKLVAKAVLEHHERADWFLIIHLLSKPCSLVLKGK
jgi:hypothetical protein